jgi:subtilisin
VYGLRASDNEERSADLSRALAVELGSDPECAARLVLATRHEATPSVSTDEALVVDIDLSILGQPEARFDEYESQVRREYAWVSEERFREGRTRILEGFLSRPSVYATMRFRGLYERAARRNLERSLKSLRPPHGPETHMGARAHTIVAFRAPEGYKDVNSQGRSGMKLFGWTLVALLVAASAALAQNDDVRVVVSFHGEPDAKAITANGGRVIGRLVYRNSLIATLPPGSAAKVKRNPNVASVGEDGIMQAFQDKGKGKPGGGGSGPSQTVDWGVLRIGARDAATRGAGVIVAVLDTGVDKTHADLKENLLLNLAADFVDAKKDVEDKNGHGTHVTGIIAAVDNTIGVVGVAPQAKIMPVQVLSASGFGSWSGLVNGLDHAGFNGARVINMSLGGSDPGLQDLYDALQAAAVNAVVVAASGNEGAAQPGFPASDPNVVAVGATNSGDGVPSWSNAGEEVLAPGASIYSTYKGGGYTTLSGTSMASPHAAGVAALVLSRGGFTAAGVRAQLTATAEPIAAGLLVDAESASKD